VLLLLLARYLEAESCAAAVNSLVFCSNVFAALEFMSNICFVFSFAFCIVVLNSSKLANTKLFVVLKADTVLSATLLTNLLYALATASGEFHLLTVVLIFC